NWRKYLSVIAPKFEGVLKSLLPLIGVAVRSFTIWRHLNDETRSKIKEIAKSGDLTLLQDTLQLMGVEEFSFEDLIALQKAAQSGDGTGFISTLGTIFLAPMAGPALDAIRQLSFSSLAVELDEELGNLALASLSSSLIRRKKLVDEDALMAEI